MIKSLFETADDEPQETIQTKKIEPDDFPVLVAAPIEQVDSATASDLPDDVYAPFAEVENFDAPENFDENNQPEKNLESNAEDDLLEISQRGEPQKAAPLVDANQNEILSSAAVPANLTAEVAPNNPARIQSGIFADALRQPPRQAAPKNENAAETMPEINFSGAETTPENAVETAPATTDNFQPESSVETIRKSGLAYSAAIVLFVSIVFMLLLGWFVDLLAGTKPWGIVGGIVLGSIIGFFNFFRITSQILKDKTEIEKD